MNPEPDGKGQEGAGSGYSSSAIGIMDRMGQKSVA